MKALAIFDLVPGWVYAIACGLLIAICGVQQVRVSGLRAGLAEARADAAAADAARSEALLAHAEEKIALLEAHRTQIEDAANAYDKKLAAAAVRAAADADTARRLRNQIDAFSRRGGTCHPATPVGQGGESAAQVLGGLLAESIDLLAESRKLHAERDAEVRLLFDQIDADRAACSARAITAP